MSPGGRSVLGAQVVEVLHASRVVALIPSADVAAVVSQRLAPGVMSAGAQPVGVPPADRSLPRCVLKSCRTVTIAGLPEPCPVRGVPGTPNGIATTKSCTRDVARACMAFWRVPSELLQNLRRTPARKG